MSYAADKTSYLCSKNFDVIQETIEEVRKSFLKWFSNFFLKANADKCHAILSTDELLSINIDTVLPLISAGPQISAAL